MPSVKSYQNRKSEIAALNRALAELEFQRNKYRQQALTLQFEKAVEQQNSNTLRGMVNAFQQREVTLKDHVYNLETRIRVYRDYIRRNNGPNYLSQ